MRPKVIFTEVQKKQIIAICTEDKTAVRAAKKFGVCKTTIYKYMRRWLGRDYHKVIPDRSGTASFPIYAKHGADIMRDFIVEEMCVGKISKKYGLPRNTLWHWLKYNLGAKKYSEVIMRRREKCNAIDEGLKEFFKSQKEYKFKHPIGFECVGCGQFKLTQDEPCPKCTQGKGGKPIYRCPVWDLSITMKSVISRHAEDTDQFVKQAALVWGEELVTV